MVIDEADVSECKYINTLVAEIDQPETTLTCCIAES